MDYILHVLVMVEIYIILSVSLNLVMGCTGLVSIAQAAFYGVGAYTSALMALCLHVQFPMSLAGALVASALIAFLLAVPSLRLREDYFVTITFAFQIIIFGVMNNWVSVTGGPMGLSGIPQPVMFGLKVTSREGFALLATCLCALAFWASRLIANSPYGRVLRAIREDEVFVQAVGKNVATYRIGVSVIGAMMAATAGAVYAHFVSFIDPASFTVMESVFIMSIVIIGGAGNLWGSVVGAFILVSLPEFLRFVGLPDPVAANTRQIIYGVLLVTLMVWRPRGLMGDYPLSGEMVKK